MKQTIISDPGKISADWLNTVLTGSKRFNGTDITDVSYDIIGTGKMGDNARLSLTYDSQSGADSAPQTLVAKLPAADPLARELASAGAAYAREVKFYQNEAQLTTMLLPQVDYAAVNDSGTEFIILMEDLAPAVPGDQIIGESLARAQLAVQQAARLHAAFWGSKNLGGDHITRHSNADSAAFGAELLKDAWPKFLLRFGDGLSQECTAFGDQFAANYQQWTQRFQGDKTLVHNDFRSENILFNDSPATPSATTVDWQSIAESSGLADVAYFLGGSLTVDDRRRAEKNLLERYRNELSQLDVALTAEQCWQQYREFAMSAFMTIVMGAVYTAADERSDKMFLTMAQRHFQQCVDLGSAEFLG